MAFSQGAVPPPHPFILHSPSSPAPSASSSKRKRPFHVPDPTDRVPPVDAAALVSAFLTRSTVDPAYRPDSILSARGPQATSTSLANPNLTLHSLEKVRDGILGKKAKRGDTDAKLGFFGRHGQVALSEATPQKRKTKGEAESAERSKDKRGKGEGKKRQEAKGSVAQSSQVDEAMKENEDEGWQDMGSFEREQDIVEGEVGDRDFDPGNERAEPEEVQIADPMDVDETPEKAVKKKKKKDQKKDKEATPDEEPTKTQSKAPITPKSKAEKEERKSSKKERRKEEKREREQARLDGKTEQGEEKKRKEKSKKSKS